MELGTYLAEKFKGVARIYILEFSLLLIALFGRSSCTECVLIYPFIGDHGITLPVYVYVHAFYVGVLGVVLNNCMQETEYKFEMKWFALIWAGRYLDFILHDNLTWFYFRGHAISYDTFMWIIFGMVIIYAWNRKQLNSELS